MKVIDLLNKIANNEEVPKEIKVYNENYIFDKKYKRYINQDNENTLGERVALDLELNNEIEIIEEKPKKIEKLLNCEIGNVKCVGSITNELIDAVNYLLEKESDK